MYGFNSFQDKDGFRELYVLSTPLLLETVLIPFRIRMGSELENTLKDLYTKKAPGFNSFQDKDGFREQKKMEKEKRSFQF